MFDWPNATCFLTSSWSAAAKQEQQQSTGAKHVLYINVLSLKGIPPLAIWKLESGPINIYAREQLSTEVGGPVMVPKYAV